MQLRSTQLVSLKCQALWKGSICWWVQTRVVATKRFKSHFTHFSKRWCLFYSVDECSVRNKVHHKCLALLQNCSSIAFKPKVMYMCSERQIWSPLMECNCVQAVIESGSVCQLCPLQKTATASLKDAVKIRDLFSSVCLRQQNRSTSFNPVKTTATNDKSQWTYKLSNLSSLQSKVKKKRT